ncbi:hypothetical protein MPC38_06735 [Prescottella equi]|uniref:hypothetical protein n=1 Tax=Rhodococcus hoagii TaxID=43767 RepID=UPI001F5B49C2|nr:hypothetical protein [Prescottella equi]UNQ40941.1 hypothetical protein MPC38_06735 [Prescottella equi]
MSTAIYIQSYGAGYIQREGKKYELVVNDKVKGSYESMDALVAANPVSDGKQVSTVDEGEEAKADFLGAGDRKAKSEKSAK